jgi:endoglucanase
VNAALDQLHYLFGRNATGNSYMTGSGTKTPLMPHSIDYTATVLFVLAYFS